MSPAPIGERVASLETRVTNIEEDVDNLEGIVGLSRENRIKVRIAMLGLLGVTITAAGGLLTALLVSGGHS